MTARTLALLFFLLAGCSAWRLHIIAEPDAATRAWQAQLYDWQRAMTAEVNDHEHRLQALEVPTMGGAHE